MTEYDYSPEAVESYMSTRERVAGWIQRHSPRQISSFVPPSSPPSRAPSESPPISAFDDYDDEFNPENARISMPPKMLLRYTDGRPDLPLEKYGESRRKRGAAPVHHPKPTSGRVRSRHKRSRESLEYITIPSSHPMDDKPRSAIPSPPRSRPPTRQPTPVRSHHSTSPSLSLKNRRRSPSPSQHFEDPPRSPRHFPLPPSLSHPSGRSRSQHFEDPPLSPRQIPLPPSMSGPSRHSNHSHSSRHSRSSSHHTQVAPREQHHDPMPTSPPMSGHHSLARSHPSAIHIGSHHPSKSSPSSHHSRVIDPPQAQDVNRSHSVRSSRSHHNRSINSHSSHTHQPAIVYAPSPHHTPKYFPPPIVPASQYGDRRSRGSRRSADRDHRHVYQQEEPDASYRLSKSSPSLPRAEKTIVLSQSSPPHMPTHIPASPHHDAHSLPRKTSVRSHHTIPRASGSHEHHPMPTRDRSVERPSSCQDHNRRQLVVRDYVHPGHRRRRDSGSSHHTRHSHHSETVGRAPTGWSIVDPPARTASRGSRRSRTSSISSASTYYVLASPGQRVEVIQNVPPRSSVPSRRRSRSVSPSLSPTSTKHSPTSPSNSEGKKSFFKHLFNFSWKSDGRGKSNKVEHGGYPESTVYSGAHSIPRTGSMMGSTAGSVPPGRRLARHNTVRV
ncbi:hypothetical protein JAAARDRAFT_40383 [Jaapia argillacea MUCL 33604]|uniref:Uncharacterized protein n=1 Tax=Jaapia argillacea MUCL 33604 TaxID=933084 RepID=A0A067PBG1_9AGAM|nr:hypothetical protein JAAARDRAFT_40383 [Jaapia argillacea MUCL 33604]